MLGLKAIKPSFSFGRMRALRLRNYVYLPLLAFLIVLVCFLLYHYPRSLERGVTKGVLLRHKSTEADVLWLRSPLIKLNPSNELTISCNVLSDGQSGSYLHGGGIFFLKANAISLEFFKYWKLTKFMFPNDPAEESLCNTIKARQDAADLYGFRAQLVNTSYFGGFCQPSKNMLREAYTIQANCCDDLESKVHDLRIVLGDWIRFRNHASGVNALDKMDLRWPLKCSTRNYT